MMQLDHPNIAKVYEYFISPKGLFIIMEYLEGGELFSKIKEQTFFSEKSAKAYLKMILQGVNYLHSKNIVHRDIKPENILFNNKGDLKLVDFGTSKFAGQRKMKNTYGTPYYVAPEVLKEDYDIKCDVWSCGVVLYILISGVPPFNGSSEQDILDTVRQGKFSFKKKQFESVSREVKDLIEKMLQKDPSKRLSALQCLNHEWFKSDV